MTEATPTPTHTQRTTPVRKRKKKYPVEALFIVAGAAFFLGGFLMWESVQTVRQVTQDNAVRIAVLEDVARATGGQVSGLLATLETNSEERTEQEKLFAEQLGALSKNVSTQQTQITGVLNMTDISRITEEWDPFVYMLSCSFTMFDGKTKEDRASAVLEKTTAGVRLLTNKHIIERKDGTFEGCVLSRPDSKVEIAVTPKSFVKSNNVDYAYAFLSVAVPAMPFSQRCTTKPSIGNHVLILGYPGIGAKESVTATDGIISGFDAENYTTSAKIEKGNSGGAAIDVGRDCFLGLPTLVVPGVIESLARILPIIGL